MTKNKIPFSRVKMAQIYNSDLDPDIWDYCQTNAQFIHYKPNDPDPNPEVIVHTDVFENMFIEQGKDLPEEIKFSLAILKLQFNSFDYIMILPTHPDNL